MTDQFWISLPNVIVALGTLAASVGAMLLSWKNHTKLETVHKEFNGMKAELVTSTARASFAEGEASGVSKEQKRTNGI